MIDNNFYYIINWFVIFFIVGVSFLPLTFKIFSSFNDKGYIFSKVIGSIILSYFVFLTGLLHIFKFSIQNILLILFFLALMNYIFPIYKKINLLKKLKPHIKIFLLEEILFFLGLSIWAVVRGNMPDINGLEKFMDFGFLNSILKAEYFPPKDMWYTPFSINYYYFGHLITAVYTKLSTLPSYITYNLMIATLFSLTFNCAFSIGLNLFDLGKQKKQSIIAGFLSSFLVTFGGNLTTIYAFFKPYIPADKPVPFWNLNFLPLNFPNDYWYPNATRFIPFTIHEFPLYSFVVSDLHGHVLDIPIVLLAIAYCLSILKKQKISFINSVIFAFLISVMYTTNAWDGLIYLLLYLFVVCYFYFYKKNKKIIVSIKNLYEVLKNLLTVIIGFILFSLPFNLNFKPFVSGIGVLCAPKFLTAVEKIGPFLFEANHCQKSPLWQLTILYGFFYFIVVMFLLFIKFKKNLKITEEVRFVFILILLSTILIIVPEFLYIKDIYPLHYRANTMFKLVYEAFIMLSIVGAFIVVKLLTQIKNKIVLSTFFLISLFLISLIFIYPVFAINSYYRNLKSYQGLDGIKYLKNLYTGDYNLINWINKNIKGQPVILEANGDSYTNYARISSNTGLPTVLGWTVHEWLWRGTYDIVAPRITDVQNLYISKNSKQFLSLIKKYKISYVVISTLEREKYPNLTEENFKKYGKIIFTSGQAKLYRINSSVLAK